MFRKLLFVFLFLITFQCNNIHAEPRRLDSLISKLQTTPFDTSRTRLLFEICAEYVPVNQDSARLYANKLIAHGATIKDNTAEAKACIVLANLYLNSKKLDSSAFFFEKARALSTITKDDLIIGRGLFGLGLIQREYKQYDKALEFFYLAKPFILKAKVAKWVNSLYNNIGGMFSAKNDLEGELKVRYELLKWNEQAKDTMYMAFSCNGIGMLYSFKGLYKESIPWEEKAAKYFAAAGNMPFMANAYGVLGEAELKLGHYDVAISKYLEAYGIAEKAGSKEIMANTLTNIASIYAELQDYTTAKEYYFRGKKLYDQLPDIDRILNNRAILHCALGDIAFRQKNYDEALKEFTIALPIAVAAPNISTTALCKLNIASIQAIRKEYPDALDNLHQALKLYQSVIENEGIGAVYGALADIHFQLKNFDSTIYFGEKSIEYSNRTNIVKQLQTTYDIVSQAYNAKNNYKKAYQYLLVADQLKDSLLTLDKTRQIGHIEATYQIQRKTENEKREREARIQAEEEARQRRNNTEYLGLLIFIFGSLVLVYFVRRTNISAKAIEKYVFFIFLLLFQFISMLLNDPIEMIAHGDQLIVLIASLAIAVAITPIHEGLHNFIVKRINRRKVNTKQYETAIISGLQKSIDIPRKSPDGIPKVDIPPSPAKNDEGDSK